MARRAERAFQYERGDKNQTFISPSNWDGTRRGFLAGERLCQDLRRMDAAYFAQNKRELEIVKMVSLAEHDPDQLANLPTVIQHSSASRRTTTTGTSATTTSAVSRRLP